MLKHLFAGCSILMLTALPVSTQAQQRPHGVQKPDETITLSIGRGQLVTLPADMSDVFVAKNDVADVQVRSSRQIYIFGKAGGETSVYATNAAGKVLYAANVRVGSNIDSIDQLLSLAMPESSIAVSTMNGLVLLTGTVASPSDSEEAISLVQAYVGEGTKVVSRLRTKTPMQVNLQVRIAEVSRSLVREIGSNLATRDNSGGFLFGASRASRDFVDITGPGRSLAGLPVLDASSQFGLPPGSISLPFDPVSGQFVAQRTAYNFNNVTDGRTAIQAAGRLFGLDVAAAFDLGEQTGLITTLSQPNLTALSGETADFLAGGEFPIPISQGFGTTTIEYRQYGVSLTYTPTVLSNGRISLRVRPEVSELSSAGAVNFNGFQVPATTVRRTETTVELGSGQSFMIAGLLSNNSQNTIDKAPGLGDVPVLGNLFKSSSYKRGETELVIVITPYLVNPVNDGDIVLPTDGYMTPNEAERLLLNRSASPKSGGERPGPVVAPDNQALRPSLPPPASEAGQGSSRRAARPASDSNTGPGFSFED